MSTVKYLLSVVSVGAICLCGAAVYGDVTFTNLFSFSGTNGIEPEGRLLQTPDGNFYGTARDTTLERWGNGNFGFNGNGLIFRITPNGDFSVVATFARSYGNGAYPRAGLTLGKDGILYGTTTGGGTNHEGTVFKITTNGNMTILTSFFGTNGRYPTGCLLQKGDSFWGTTARGGMTDSREHIDMRAGMGGGMGTIFSINLQGAISTLVFFEKTNGEFPSGELIQGKNGNIYGTTSQGGIDWLVRNNLTNQYCGDGFGTVFKISPRTGLTTIAAFNGENGLGPTNIRLTKDGNLYGITADGGATNAAPPDGTFSWRPFTGAGTVFKISPEDRLTTVVLFNGTNGQNPDSLILGNDDNFYGTTAHGGANSLGTIFKLTPNGKFTTLYSFAEGSGSWPNRFSVIQGLDGNLYGTTARSGKNGSGSIFRLTIK